MLDIILRKAGPEVSFSYPKNIIRLLKSIRNQRPHLTDNPAVGKARLGDK